MTEEKKFKFAGVAKHMDRTKGKFKVYYTNSRARIDSYAEWGWKQIDIIELKQPMTKFEAVDFLLNCKEYVNNDVEVQECLLNTLTKQPRNKLPKQRSDKTAEVPNSAVTANNDAAPSVDPKDKLAEILARGKAKAALSKAEIAKQMADLEDAPY